MLAIGNTVVTADMGIAKAATDNGFPVLSIDKGHITLPPYGYGFIGGALMVFEDQLLAIGDLETHPNGKEIKALAEQNGLTVLSLSTGPLFDCGGILFLNEDAFEECGKKGR